MNKLSLFEDPSQLISKKEDEMSHLITHSSIQHITRMVSSLISSSSVILVVLTVWFFYFTQVGMHLQPRSVRSFSGYFAVSILSLLAKTSHSTTNSDVIVQLLLPFAFILASFTFLIRTSLLLLQLGRMHKAILLISVVFFLFAWIVHTSVTLSLFGLFDALSGAKHENAIAPIIIMNPSMLALLFVSSTWALQTFLRR
jgi:hypothetical protein